MHNAAMYRIARLVIAAVCLYFLTLSPLTRANTGTAAQDSDFIFKTVDPSLAGVGEVLTYTVTIQNPRPETLRQVVITDYYDSRLDDLSILEAPAGNITINGSVITFSGFDLAGGGSLRMVIQGRVAPQVRAGDVITSTATLEAPDASIYLSNVVQTTVIPTNLPDTGALNRAAWLLWNLIPVVLLLSLAGLGWVSWQTHKVHRQPR